MALITDDNKKTVSERFSDKMTSEIKLVHFSQFNIPGQAPVQECRNCQETDELMREVSQLSTKVELEEHDFAAERDVATSYGIEMIPATMISTDTKSGIYYFGMPSGYELNAFVDDIIDLSRGETDLPADMKEKLRSIEKDVHIQVFTLPT